MSGIFNGDKKKIGPYLRSLADTMGLRDWTVCVVDKPVDNPDYSAEADIRYGRKIINIALAHDWSSWDTESFRSTCVHELVHAHTKPMQWALNNAQTALGIAAFTVLDGAFQDAHETCVDAIATEWAKTLPLPIRSKAQNKRKVKAA